jgi:hypothetical protein
VDLPLWDADTVRAMRTGARLEGWHPSFPREDDVDAGGLWVEGDPWGPRSIVVDGLVAGSIGFFGPPAPAASLALAAKAGFTEIRGTNEDGELVLVRPLP